MQGTRRWMQVANNRSLKHQPTSRPEIAKKRAKKEGRQHGATPYTYNFQFLAQRLVGPGSSVSRCNRAARVRAGPT